MAIDCRLNPYVLDALRLGAVACNHRAVGKTTTLLTYIAVTWPASKLGAGGPIIVTKNLQMVDWLRSLWKELFPDHPMPRFRTYKQNFLGMSGVIFTDEVDPNDLYFLIDGQHLMYGGGVLSY